CPGADGGLEGALLPHGGVDVGDGDAVARGGLGDLVGVGARIGRVPQVAVGLVGGLGEAPTRDGGEAVGATAALEARVGAQEGLEAAALGGCGADALLGGAQGAQGVLVEAEGAVEGDLGGGGGAQRGGGGRGLRGGEGG